MRALFRQRLARYFYYAQILIVNPDAAFKESLVAFIRVGHFNLWLHVEDISVQLINLLAPDVIEFSTGSEFQAR